MGRFPDRDAFLPRFALSGEDGHSERTIGQRKTTGGKPGLIRHPEGFFEDESSEGSARTSTVRLP